MSDYWQYNFPPFFTIQPNEDTRRLQLEAWNEIVLDHCRRHRIFVLNTSEVLQVAPFKNDSINRRLSAQALETILKYMASKGRIDWIKDELTVSKVANTSKSICLVYWRKPEEWASIILKWVDSKALKGTICTLNDITGDEQSSSPDLLGLEEKILMKALFALEQQGRAAIIKVDGSFGVKFL